MRGCTTVALIPNKVPTKCCKKFKTQINIILLGNAMKETLTLLEATEIKDRNV